MKKVWLYGYVVCLTAGLLAAGCAGKEKKPEKPVEPAAVEEEAAPAEEAVIEVEPAKPEELSKENGLLTVDKPVYDFGELEPKKKFQGEYVLKNEGKAALEIQNPVRKSCGCTELKLDKYKLEPGESALLKVVYTSNSSPGETEKHIWVDVVPPGQPKTLTLKLKARVSQHVQAMPEKLEFQIRDTPDNVGEVTLKSLDGSEFAITSINSSGNAVEGVFDPQVKGTELKVPLKLKQDSLRKVQNGVLNIMINHPKVDSVPINFKVEPPFAANPRTQFFRDMERNKVQKVQVTVVSNYNEPFEISNLRSEKGFIKVVNQSRDESTNSYKIELEVTAPETGNILNDYLYVEIAGRPEDTLKVHCYGRIKKD
ncbi:MAG: hypothetical protein BWY71_01811 [Planctomycetes bacterium ADurb.Bin412]|nr:MAG: hypothetical protein BWY71_01811 [Planctomycetes bacterium ADurb.Bin412]